MLKKIAHFKAGFGRICENFSLFYEIIYLDLVVLTHFWWNLGVLGFFIIEDFTFFDLATLQTTPHIKKGC